MIFAKKINTTFLLLGSNMGNSLELLQQATSLIKTELGEVIDQSSIYETEAWGNKNQNNFLNQIIQIGTTKYVHQTLKKILQIETKLGRIRQEKMGPRTIDIDILFFNDEIIEEKDLQIPHPRMQDRKFVLVPLNEIAPNFIHPIYKQTINQLLQNCKDTLDVKKFC